MGIKHLHQLFKLNTPISTTIIMNTTHINTTFRRPHEWFTRTDTPILALSPMAGITDKPFRQICRDFGADWAVSEMLTSDPSLRHTRKTLYRSNHQGESGIIAVQIAGSQPEQMAEAARYNVAQGAQVIDINMGCPAKKVCNVSAGSALLQNETLVSDILHAVVAAVDVPVTLKTRLGWHDEHRNITTIAQIAEEAGIALLAIHGRTRTQMYKGEASYDLIATVKQQSNLPIWANGDITSPQKALIVWQQTLSDGLMIGRAAQGQPWIFRDIRHYLHTGQLPEAISFETASKTILTHLDNIYDFYGEHSGVRIARKHIGWYLEQLPNHESTRKAANQAEHTTIQRQIVADFLSSQTLDFWPCSYR